MGPTGNRVRTVAQAVERRENGFTNQVPRRSPVQVRLVLGLPLLLQ